MKLLKVHARFYDPDSHAYIDASPEADVYVPHDAVLMVYEAMFSRLNGTDVTRPVIVTRPPMAKAMIVSMDKLLPEVLAELRAP